ncbi:two-component sensor histidine kinase [Rhizobium sp. SG_E_25_P2]|uniref:sensor histidine kinase n=1 Tax=Rhizobium sp. SG_E_25_P2 TaxID=2879942 RepID=UPI002474B51B|nr:ATP-binding protein [Rhizobium sp. SG_E_25_P2]MDH6266700.1 two-component sensor histidine kinase [Rhizobium sp. SG_E_25_P2]
MMDGSKWRTLPASLAALRWGSLLLPIVVGVIWAIFSFGASERQAISTARSNAHLIHQFVDRLAQTHTLVHQAVRERARGEDLAFLRSQPFHLFLDGMEQSQKNSLGLLIVGFDGELIASSRSYPIKVKFGRRDYIEAIRNGQQIFVDRVMLNQGKSDAIIFAQPFSARDFAGVIVSAVAVDALRNYLQTIAEDGGNAASVMRFDGKLLVRNFVAPPSFLPPDAGAMVALKSGEEIIRTVAKTDGVERIYAMALLPDLSLVVNFGVTAASITSGWVAHVAPILGAILALGAIGFVLVGKVRSDLAAHSSRREAEESQRRREEAEKLAVERERLMQELNHRVKNNLALVEAMIGMQMRRQTAIDGAELRARVHAISEVHELLYRAGGDSQVDLANLIDHICHSPAIIPEERNVVVRFSHDGPIPLKADRATPLALIVTELLTNSVKHAFTDGNDGKIDIRLEKAAGDIRLSVQDNGVGLPETTERSSGLTMVRAFAQQIGGNLEILREERRGAHFIIHFSDDEGSPQ